MTMACQPEKNQLFPSNENSEIFIMCHKYCKTPSCGSLPYLASSGPVISDRPCSSEEFKNSATHRGKGVVSGTPRCSEQKLIH